MVNLFILLLITAIITYLVFKFWSKTSAALWFVSSWWRFLEEKCYVYQLFKVPQFNENMQENQLYRKVYTYLNSLPAVENSDLANLFSGAKANEINIVLDQDHRIIDSFLNVKMCWRNDTCGESGRKSLVLRIRKNDRRRILRPYLQHINGVFDEIVKQNKEVKLFINVEGDVKKRWISFPFTHPATIDTVVMESDLKNKVKSDLETFMKSKQSYNRLGRIWKRSYLLYGQSGTGKSTFIAAMAKFLNYDVYEIDFSRVLNDSDLKLLLLQTTSKSLIVIEDLDRILIEKQKSVSFSGLLNFMDGLVSSCGEERVMVFTMNSKDRVDPTVLRPGRIDIHIHFPNCDFTAFKTMANSHLKLKDHKLFSQVEEIFENGGSLSPSEIGEIMISNRSSPSRALKSVISALQRNAADATVVAASRKLNEYGSVRIVDEDGDSGIFCREGFHTVKEWRKLYGFFRKSSRHESIDFDSAPQSGEKEKSI